MLNYYDLTPEMKKIQRWVVVHIFNDEAIAAQEKAFEAQKKLLQDKKLKQIEIAKICNTNKHIVNSINKGRTWKHVQV